MTTDEKYRRYYQHFISIGLSPERAEEAAAIASGMEKGCTDID